MARAWDIWMTAVALFAAYCGLALLASHFADSGASTSLRLRPGYATTVNVWTPASSKLSVSLHYGEGIARRICSEEAGELQQVFPNRDVTNAQGIRAGLDGRYIRPNATVRLAIATPGSTPVPLTSQDRHRQTHFMGPHAELDHATARNQLESLVAVPLAYGWTTIQVTVQSADAPLAGEEATVLVHTQRSFHAADPVYGWLVWADFWMFMLPLFVIWFGILFAMTIWRWSRGY